MSPCNFGITKLRHCLPIIYLCASARIFACIANWHTSKHNDSCVLPHVNVRGPLLLLVLVIVVHIFVGVSRDEVVVVVLVMGMVMGGAVVVVVFVVVTVQMHIFHNSLDFLFHHLVYVEY